VWIDIIRGVAADVGGRGELATTRPTVLRQCESRNVKPNGWWRCYLSRFYVDRYIVGREQDQQGACRRRNALSVVSQ